VALVACPSGAISGTPAITALGQPTWRSSGPLRDAELAAPSPQLRLRWEGVSTKPSLQGQIGHESAVSLAVPAVRFVAVAEEDVGLTRMRG
jgi:hypothetical protein